METTKLGMLICLDKYEVAYCDENCCGMLIFFDECWFFKYTHFYIGNIIGLAIIVRAPSSNKIVFVFLQKVNISIATKLCVKLINNCKQKWFRKDEAQHNSMTKLCYAFFK